MARMRGLCAVIWLLSGLVDLPLSVAKGWAISEGENSYIRRTLSAKRLSTSPTIDGDVSDAVWQEAAVGDAFTDTRTNELVADQTRFWLGYDNAAIYLAAYCWDSQPDQLVMQETKRDGALWSDDNLEFTVDAFHTHNGGDSSRFQVNPRGTQTSRMGGGRSGKTEWKGDWRAAAKVVQDGWTVEMAIPWAILNYPNQQAPATLGFNIRRRHARQQMGSWFSNLTTQWREEYTADWVGVELPAGGFRQELLILPFLAGCFRLRSAHAPAEPGERGPQVRFERMAVYSTGGRTRIPPGRCGESRCLLAKWETLVVSRPLFPQPAIPCQQWVCGFPRMTRHVVQGWL